jgi:murein DD-endopeptidase MepM/ murein hydrolase activator NlpD
MVDHGNNFYTLYAHLRSRSPHKVGEWVEAGDIIARVGNTGNARRIPKEFQNQLHFEVLHVPSGLMDMGGLQITAQLSPQRITTLREIGEAVYGIYWGGALNPEDIGEFQ